MRFRPSPFQSGWRRFLPFIGGFLVAATVIIGLNLKNTSPLPAATAPDTHSAKPASHRPQLVSKPVRPGRETEKLSAVEKFVRAESLRVGRADSHPDQTHARLKAVAKSLGRSDTEALRLGALNTAYDGDRRFLSVYLLALAESSASVSALLSVALGPLSIQDVSSRQYAEELMIRTQALEGLANQRPAALRHFLARQDNAFLADQARRLLHEKTANP